MRSGSSTEQSQLQAGWEIWPPLAAQLCVTIRSAFNIHYPTDSSLLGDGVRVLTRTMKKVTAIAGNVGATLRNRRRGDTRRLWEIGRIARSKGAQRQEKLTRAYQQLIASTSRVVGQAKRFSREIKAGVKKAADVLQQAALDGFRRELETFVPRV